MGHNYYTTRVGPLPIFSLLHGLDFKTYKYKWAYYQGSAFGSTQSILIKFLTSIKHVLVSSTTVEA